MRIHETPRQRRHNNTNNNNNNSNNNSSQQTGDDYYAAHDDDKIEDNNEKDNDFNDDDDKKILDHKNQRQRRSTYVFILKKSVLFFVVFVVTRNLLNKYSYSSQEKSHPVAEPIIIIKTSSLSQQLQNQNQNQNPQHENGNENKSLLLYQRSTTLPQWMKDYFDWHRNQTSTLNETNWFLPDRPKYLLLRCSKSSSRCGGLSDRLKPLPLFVVAAALSKPKPRLLWILWERPAQLEEFLVPNEINWTVPLYVRNYLKPDRNLKLNNDRNKKKNNNNKEENERLGRLQRLRRLKNITLDNTITESLVNGLYKTNNQPSYDDKTIVECRIQNSDGGARAYQMIIEYEFRQSKNQSSSSTGGLLNYQDKDKQYKDIVGALIEPLEIRGDQSYRKFYHDLFRVFFTPSKPIQNLVDAKLKAGNLIPGQFIGSHYRGLYARQQKEAKEQINNDKSQVIETKESYTEKQRIREEAIRTVFDCATKLIQQQPSAGSIMQPPPAIYFASDSDTALEAVQSYTPISSSQDDNNLPKVITFRQEKVSSSSSSALAGKNNVHIDDTKDWEKRPVSDFYPAFVDLLVMAESMCQLYGVGGFGSFASLLNYNSSCYYNTKSSLKRRKKKTNNTTVISSSSLSSRKKDDVWIRTGKCSTSETDGRIPKSCCI